MFPLDESETDVHQSVRMGVYCGEQGSGLRETKPCLPKRLPAPTLHLVMICLLSDERSEL